MSAASVLAKASLNAVAALAFTATTVLAQGPDTTTNTTYTFVADPGSERIDVSHVTTIANPNKAGKKAPRIGFSGWGSVQVPVEAEGLKFKGRKVKGELTGGDDVYTFHMLGFPTIWNKKKLKVTTNYTVQAEGPQRSRFEPSYAHICWPGMAGVRARWSS